MRPESPTSPRRLRARDRWQKCLELRRGGATFSQIADQVGYSSPRRAQEAVQKILREMVEPASDEIRAFEISRLDRLLLSHWMNALQPSSCPRCKGVGTIVSGEDEKACPACRGLGGTDLQLRSADIVLKVLDRLHRLKGLDKSILDEALSGDGERTIRIVRESTWRKDATIEEGSSVEAVEITERAAPLENPIERLAAWRTGGNGRGNGRNGDSNEGDSNG